MKRKKYLLLLWFLVLSLSACATACPCRNNGSTGGGSTEFLRFLELPAIEARTADDPVKTVFLSLALGFYREGVGAELERHRSTVSETVRSAVAPFRAAELNSVEGYERLRRAIIARLNDMLASGRVERVVIRSISVR